MAKSEPPKRWCRKRPSSGLRRAILEAQEDRCLGCGAGFGEAEFDHVIPLGLGGDNAPDNWAALCGRCHKTKTRADLKRIAKAKRQRRYHETGRSRAKTRFAPIAGQKASGFDTSLRRHLNGAVSRKCRCPACWCKDGA